MPEIPSWAIETLKVGGITGFMFLIWYLYHTAQVKQWNRIFDAQETQRVRDFELLKDTIETVGMHTAILARIEQKIDTGQACKGGITLPAHLPQVHPPTIMRS